jgi:hypothetical protein
MKRKEEKAGKQEKPPAIKKPYRWHSLAELKRAIRASAGFVTQAAKKAGMSYKALYERIQKSPELKLLLEETLEEKLDFAEGHLMQLVGTGELGAICFFLKTKGKKRGFVERVEQEHSGKDGAPLAMVIQVVSPRAKELVEKTLKGEGL